MLRAPYMNHSKVEVTMSNEENTIEDDIEELQRIENEELDELEDDEEEIEDEDEEEDEEEFDDEDDDVE
jgi:segregation and condensation protein B